MKTTPESSAQNLRDFCLGDWQCGSLPVGHIFFLPRTWEEYFTMPTGFDRMSAYKAINDIMVHTKCTSEEALAAVEKVMPELFADYWEALPFPDKQAE